MRAAVLPLLLFASACAHVSTECSAHGGGGWSRVESAHFAVSTNLPPDAARGAVLKLEMARAVVSPALRAPELTGRPLDVVLLANADNLVELSGADETFWAEDWRGPVLVLRDDAAVLAENPQLSRTVHELTHVLQARTFRRLPRWVSEGLATYLETANVDLQEKSARRGRANQVRLADIERWSLLPVEALWAWTQEEPDKPGLEQHRVASAWFWVYWLFNAQRPAFEKFLDALGRGDEPSRAWKTAFPELTTQSMTEASERFRKDGRTTGQSLDLSRMDQDFKVTALTDAQVHVVRSRLAGLKADWSKAMGEANAAKSFPGDDGLVLEQFASTRAQADERLAATAALTELEPKRAEGWLLRGLAETDAAAKRTAFFKALELDPQLVAAAAELAQSSTGTEAIDFARKAFGEVATARALSTSADVLARSGLCGEALSLELRALETLSHAAERTVGAKLHARLDTLAKCAR